MTTPVWQEGAPPGWHLGRLKDLVDSCRNGTWGDEPADESEIGTPTVRVADFDWLRLRVRLPVPTRRMVQPRQLQRVGLDNGDLVLEKSGGGENQPVGRAVRFEGSGPAVCSNFTARLRPSRNAESRFLCYSLAAAYWSGINTKSIKQTTGIQNLDSNSYLSEAWSYPNVETQTAISDLLDRETERIDRLVEKKRRLIELLEEKRTALISHAVTKGLDPTVPMKDSGIPWLGEIPAHWDAAPLKRVAQIRYGLGQPPPTSDDGIPIIRATNINSGRITDEGMIYAALADLPLDRAPLLRAGEILVVRSGALTGDSAIVPKRYAGAAPGYDLRLTASEAMPRFIAWSLLGQFALSQIDLAKSRAAQPHINAEEVGELLLALPPLREQDHIADRLDGADEALSTASEKLAVQLDKLAEYRQALITAAVTGQLDVTAETPGKEGVVA